MAQKSKEKGLSRYKHVTLGGVTIWYDDTTQPATLIAVRLLYDKWTFIPAEGSVFIGVDTVGSKQIKDGAVQLYDLSDELKERILNATFTTFTLETSSNPKFTVFNSGAAEFYKTQMGGYALLVKDDKTYAAKLNSDDWTKFSDGTAFTTALEGVTETMIHVPDCYFKAAGKTMEFGGTSPIENGKVFDSPHWVGAYKISYDATNVAHSRPGLSPKHSQTLTEFWNASQRLGSQWGLANYGFHCLINALYQACYGDLDSQTTIGTGFSASEWEHARDIPMGLLKSLGDASGNMYYTDNVVGDQYPVKLFGFEDLWGKLWEFRPGIRFEVRSNVRYAVVYSGNIVSNTATGREFACSIKTTSGDFVKSMELGEYWDMIAQSVSGASDSTYYCDGYYAKSDGQLLYVGGGSNNGTRGGLSCASSNSGFSISTANFGARLAYYGEPEIVSGAELAALAAV